MICKYCHCVFCWDDADEGTFGGDRRRYCSRTCDRAARKRRKRDRDHRETVLRYLCSIRPKPAYSSEHDALLVAAELRRIPPLTAYECTGHWHLTSEPQP